MEGRRRVFLDSREDGKRRRKQIGKTPRVALTHGEQPPERLMAQFPMMRDTTDGSTDTPGISIEDGVQLYPEAVKATKGIGTFGSYKARLTWAERHITKRLVNRLNRNGVDNHMLETCKAVAFGQVLIVVTVKAHTRSNAARHGRRQFPTPARPTLVVNRGFCTNGGTPMHRT